MHWSNLLPAILLLSIVLIPVLSKKKSENYTASQVRKCTAAGGKCIDTRRTRCSTTPLVGKCPGNRHIRCCVERPSPRPDPSPTPSPAPRPAPGPTPAGECGRLGGECINVDNQNCNNTPLRG